jgi:hypothetical protein
MMSQAKFGYTYWQQPNLEAMPAVSEVRARAGAAMGVTIEGSHDSWPSYGAPAAVLPPLDHVSKRVRWIELFNRGGQPYGYTISSNQPWVKMSARRGTVVDALRVDLSAEWSKVPKGSTTAIIAIEAENGERVEVQLPVHRPSAPPAQNFRGHIETDGHIAIEAPNFSRAVNRGDVRWMRLTDFGRTQGGVTPMPVTSSVQSPGGSAPRLEYDVHLFSTGEVTVELHCSPSLDFQSGEGLRVAVSFDGAAPQVIKLDTWANEENWSRAVADSVRRVVSKHTIAKPGRHVIKLWMVTPGVVVQRIVVDAGGVRASYLGPPESPRGMAR